MARRKPDVEEVQQPPAVFVSSIGEFERQAAIELKAEDIRDQEALERAMGNTGRAAQHKARRLLLLEAGKLPAESAWAKALELTRTFFEISETDSPFEKEQALWDAHLYAYAAHGRGLDTMELIKALEPKPEEVITDANSE
jgi:hypothetical protein